MLVGSVGGALPIAAMGAEVPAEDAVESQQKGAQQGLRAHEAGSVPRPWELARLPCLVVPERLGNTLEASRQLVAVGAERQAQLLGRQLL